MSIGLLNSKYQFFLNTEYTRMSFTRLGLHVLEALGIVLLYKELKQKNKFMDFFVLNSTIFLALHQLATMILYGQRIAIYFAFSNIITLCMFTRTDREIYVFKKNVKLKYIIIVTILSLSLYYWYYQYVLSLSSETFPYMFGF